MLTTSNRSSSKTQRDPPEGTQTKKITKGFIKYLCFPYENSLNRFRKYGIYCPNLEIEEKTVLNFSHSFIKRMKLTCSLNLNFPLIRSTSLNYRTISEGLKNLSTMISFAKNLHSFTIRLNQCDNIQKMRLYQLFKKLYNLKKISLINIRISGKTINLAEVKHLLKAQKNLSKLDLLFAGISILETGFICLNETIAYCQNLSDLSIYFGYSPQIIPSMITNQFFSELSKLKELKALTLTFSKAVF